MSSSLSTIDTHELLENALGRPAGAHESRLRKVNWRPREIVLGLAVLLAWRLLMLCNPSWTNSMSVHGSFFISAGFPALWMILFPYIVARHRGIRDILSEFNGRRIAKEAIVTLPVALLALLCLALVSSLRVYLGGEPLGAPQNTAARSDVFALVLMSITVTPIAEELFFRGFIYNCFRRTSPMWIAILVQAGIFAIMHPYSLERTVAVLFLGVALGLVYEWRKTLVAPIIIHTTINVFAAAATALVLLVQLSTPYVGIQGTATAAGYQVEDLAPSGPAAEAGLKPGDLIVEFDGQRPDPAKGIAPLLAFQEVGEKVEVAVRRGEETLKLSLTLARRPRE